MILPEAEYDRMIEEIQDLRDSLIARRVLSKIESGEEELLTSVEADELLAAKSQLGFWRKKRGMTQAALADAAGISQAFLSEIESGQKPGTAATLKKIADVLRLKSRQWLKHSDRSAQRAHEHCQLSVSNRDAGPRLHFGGRAKCCFHRS